MTYARNRISPSFSYVKAKCCVGATQAAVQLELYKSFLFRGDPLSRVGPDGGLLEVRPYRELVEI